MSRFLKLKKAFEENDGAVSNELTLKSFDWWDDGEVIHYSEEYVGYPRERTIWQVDKATGQSRHSGCGPYDCWSEWAA